MLRCSIERETDFLAAARKSGSSSGLSCRRDFSVPMRCALFAPIPPHQDDDDDDDGGDGFFFVSPKPAGRSVGMRSRAGGD